MQENRLHESPVASTVLEDVSVGHSAVAELPPCLTVKKNDQSADSHERERAKSVVAITFVPVRLHRYKQATLKVLHPPGQHRVGEDSAIRSINII